MKIEVFYLQSKDVFTGGAGMCATLIDLDKGCRECFFFHDRVIKISRDKQDRAISVVNNNIFN